jgi:hypothetical protein
MNMRRLTKSGLLIGAAVVAVSSTVTSMAATLSPSPATSPAAATAAPAATPKPTPVGTPSYKAVPRPGVAAPKPATAPPQGKKQVKPVPGVVAPKPAATAGPSVAPALANTTCTLAAGTRSCQLWAKPGTITVAGMTTPLPVWGFSLTQGGAALIPGPTLVQIAGETLSLTLHNNLPGTAGALSLEVPAYVAPANSPGPDIAGINSGNATRVYTFSGLAPGTYIYEAGATPNGNRQVAMGLTGIIVVRPANFNVSTCRVAYAGSTPAACDGTPFTNESPLQLNEFSSAFNRAATTANLSEYKPDVFLVNGRSFDPANPTVGAIPVNHLDKLLLRYADLGLRERSISIANARQTQLASDGKILGVQGEVGSVYLNPSQTMDALTTIDNTMAVNSLIPLYDQGHHLVYWQANRAFEGGGMGGMMSMLQVVTPGTGSPVGPATHVTVSPKTNDVNPLPALNNPDDIKVATVITSSLVAGVVDQAEWFFDTPGAPGTGTPLPANTCVGGNNHCFTVPVAQLASLLTTAATRDGAHVVWVRGHDANGWGIASGDTFSVDLAGALITAPSLHSTPTNLARVNDLDGTTDLDVVGSAAAALPGWVVTAVEACIDSPCQTTLDANPTFDQGALKFGPFTAPSYGIPLVTANTTGVNDPAAAIVGFGGAIPVGSLPTTPGTHTVYLHACEAAVALLVPVTPANCGRWNDAMVTSLDFVVDTAGPATLAGALLPNPNNGFVSGPGNASFLNQERVDATLNDTGFGGSPISMGEVFISQPNVLPWCYQGAQVPPLTGLACSPTPPANFFGTGAEMVPVGGKWNVNVAQPASAFIPLPDVRAFPEGHVWFWVHGLDQAGNWAPVADNLGVPIAGMFLDLTLDKTPPTVTTTATKNASTTDIVINATDPVSGGVNSNIVAAEWFDAPCTPEELATCFNDPGPGNGTAIPVPSPATSLTLNLTVPNEAVGRSIYVRVMDAAGNWSVVAYNQPVITY